MVIRRRARTSGPSRAERTEDVAMVIAELRVLAERLNGATARLERIAGLEPPAPPTAPREVRRAPGVTREDG